MKLHRYKRSYTYELECEDIIGIHVNTFIYRTMNMIIKKAYALRRYLKRISFNPVVSGDTLCYN